MISRLSSCGLTLLSFVVDDICVVMIVWRSERSCTCYICSDPRFSVVHNRMPIWKFLQANYWPLGLGLGLDFCASYSGFDLWKCCRGGCAHVPNPSLSLSIPFYHPSLLFLPFNNIYVYSVALICYCKTQWTNNYFKPRSSWLVIQLGNQSINQFICRTEKYCLSQRMDPWRFQPPNILMHL